MARSPSACPAGGTSPADRCCNLPSTAVAVAVVCPAAAVAAAAARGSGPRVSLSAARQPDNKYFYTGHGIFLRELEIKIFPKFIILENDE